MTSGRAAPASARRRRPTTITGAIATQNRRQKPVRRQSARRIAPIVSAASMT